MRSAKSRWSVQPLAKQVFNYAVLSKYRVLFTSSKKETKSYLIGSKTVRKNRC